MYSAIADDKATEHQESAIVKIVVEDDSEDLDEDQDCDDKGQHRENEPANEREEDKNEKNTEDKLKVGYQHCMKSLLQNIPDNNECDEKDVSINFDTVAISDDYGDHDIGDTDKRESRYRIEETDDDDEREEVVDNMSAFIDSAFAINEKDLNDEVVPEATNPKLILLISPGVVREEDNHSDVNSADTVSRTGVTYLSVDTLAEKHIRYSWHQRRFYFKGNYIALAILLKGQGGFKF